MRFSSSTLILVIIMFGILIFVSDISFSESVSTDIDDVNDGVLFSKIEQAAQNKNWEQLKELLDQLPESEYAGFIARMSSIIPDEYLITLEQEIKMTCP